MAPTSRSSASSTASCSSAFPIRSLSRIVQIWEKPPQFERNGVSALNFLDWKDQATSFEFMAARTGDSLTLTGHGEPIQLRATRATARYFDVLGIKAATGRTFAADEDQPGKDRVAVISHRVWQTTFGGRPDVLTHSIVLNGDTYSIIGVLPEGSEFDHAALPRSGCRSCFGARRSCATSTT